MGVTNHLKDKKYVAYLDVLGFKEIVKEKGLKLDKYFQTIGDALSDINKDKPRINSQLVSDSTILECDLTNEDLRLLLKAVQTIQSRCAVQNIWLRGAISLGDIYFDSNLKIVVGNGLSEAYLLEMQEKFPRIMIDPRIVKDSFGTRNEFICICNNNYTRSLEIPLIHDIRIPSKFIETDSLFVSFGQRIILENLDNLEVIYNHIQSELYNSQTNYQKYLWLKNYFSEVTESLPDSGFYNKFDNIKRTKINNTLHEYQNKFESL